MIQEAKDVYSLFNVKVKESLSDVTVKALVQEAPTKPLFKITSQPATIGNF